MNCESCLFWKAKKNPPNHEESTGMCRRHPPVLIDSAVYFEVSREMRHANSEHDIDEVDRSWAVPFNTPPAWCQPVTCWDSWCGEFQAASNMAAPQEPASDAEPPNDYEIDDMPFDELFSTEVCDALEDYDWERKERSICTIDTLVQYTAEKLLSRESFNEEMLREVRGVLALHDLRLKGDPRVA